MEYSPHRYVKTRKTDFKYNIDASIYTEDVGTFSNLTSSKPTSWPFSQIIILHV